MTYTFFGVDDWKELPMAEMIIAAVAVVAAMIRLAWIKRIGVFLGGAALALNMMGLVVGARLANVHNPDPYFRIWAAISIWPEPGLWIALAACALLIVGGLSRWPVGIAVREATVGTCEPQYHAGVAGGDVHGIPIQSLGRNDDF